MCCSSLPAQLYIYLLRLFPGPHSLCLCYIERLFAARVLYKRFQRQKRQVQTATERENNVSTPRHLLLDRCCCCRPAKNFIGRRRCMHNNSLGAFGVSSGAFLELVPILFNALPSCDGRIRPRGYGALIIVPLLLLLLLVLFRLRPPKRREKRRPKNNSNTKKERKKEPQPAVAVCVCV